MDLKKLSRYMMATVAMAIVYYSVSTEDLGAKSYLIQEIRQEATSGDAIYDADDVQVYVMTDRELLVPISIEADEQVDDEIKNIFNALTTQSDRLPVGVESTLGPDVALHHYTLQNKTLTLDMSSDFLSYQEKHGRALFESLVFTFTSIEGIEKLKFKVDGEPLDLKMLSLDNSDGLTQEMKINLELGTLTSAYMQPVTLHFYTTINQTDVLVPVTHLVPSSENVVDYILEHLKVGSLDGTYYTLLGNTVRLIEEQRMEDGILALNFNEAIYYSYDEPVISTQLVKQLEKTFLALPDVKGISLRVNGEETILDTNQEPVSNLLMPTISK